MDNTVINNTAQDSHSTMVNSQAETGITAINQGVQNANCIQAGTLLCDVYEVIEKLNIVTGEADLYLCSFAARKYIAKVYRRKIAVKPEVAQRLSQIHSPFVARIFAMGEYDGYPVEVLPYFSHGSLAGKRFTYDQLKYEIIPSVNEGLHILHENGIIHKDVKPSNIMLNNDGRTAAIIDFGISSLRENGATVIVTKTGLTPEYSAPETFRNLFLNESDYYSFGVTIYELFCGHTPYSEMNQEEIEQFISIQKLPMPEGMEQDLQNLINALTYPDITNRRDKTNPNRRWGYDEVNNWCNDVPQPIPGEATKQSTSKSNVTQPVENHEDDMLPYRFGGKSITSTVVLVESLNERWDEAKKHLLRGLLLAHFKKDSNAEIISNLMDIEEEADTTDADVLLFRSLYLIDSTLRSFLWKGKKYSNLSEFGEQSLTAIRQNDESFLNSLDEILNKGILSQYLVLVESNALEHIETVKSLETKYSLIKTSSLDNKRICWYQVAYLLSDKKDFFVDGHSFEDVRSFSEYITSQALETNKSFEEELRSKIFENDEFDVEFSCWLNAIGQPELISGRSKPKAFFSLMYRLNDEIKTLAWNGHEYANIKDLGEKHLDALRRNDMEALESTDTMASLGLITYYAENIEKIKKRKLDKIKKLVSAISATLSDPRGRDYWLSEYQLAYLMSEETKLVFVGNEFDNPDDFIEYIDSFIKNTQDSLVAYYCSNVISEKGVLDPQIDAWLSSVCTIEKVEYYKDLLQKYRTYAILLQKRRELDKEPEFVTEKKAISLANAFDNMNDFLDSRDHARDCVELARSIKYNELLARLEALSSVPNEKLERQLQSIADGFAELGDYKNAKEIEIDCRGEIAAIEKRIEYQRILKRMYESSNAFQNERESIFLECAEAFERISDYKDASDKANECRKKADSIHKTNIYNMAVRKKNQAKKTDGSEQKAILLDAIQLFESVVGLYDSKQQADECRELFSGLV